MSNYLKNFKIFFSVCLFSTIPHLIKAQTCILIEVRNDTVVIGADSKVGVITYSTDPNIRTAKPFSSTNNCKISKEKNIFYVASGHEAGTLLKYAKESIDKQNGPTDAIDYLVNDAQRHLETDLEKSRLYNHDDFMIIFKRKIFGHVAFVWFYNGKPKVNRYEFRITSDSNEVVKVKIVEQRFVFPFDNKLRTVPLGTYGAIWSQLSDVNFWRRYYSLEKATERLLIIQSIATPKTVGPPYSIVRILNNSIRWYKKGLCNF